MINHFSATTPQRAAIKKTIGEIIAIYEEEVRGVRLLHEVDVTSPSHRVRITGFVLVDDNGETEFNLDGIGVRASAYFNPEVFA